MNIDELRAAALSARAAADAAPEDASLADAAKAAEEALATAEAAAAKTGKGKKAPAVDADPVKIKVRVIGFHPDYAIDDVPLLTEAEVVSALRGGWADDNPEAVAYAESLSAV